MPVTAPRAPILFALSLLLAACASHTTTETPNEPPPDWAMLVTVEPIDPAPTDTPPWLRPARYALDPDGYLHAETGPGVVKPGFPPIARRLEPAEIDRLYALARQLRNDEPDAPTVPGVDVYAPPTDRRVVLLEIFERGRDTATEHPAGPAAPSQSLIRELARLAWLDR